MADKYVIFKIEDWQEMITKTKGFGLGGDVDPILPPACGPLMELNGKAIDDGVVIRRQDVFAPAALASYSNSILTALSVARLHEVGEPNETARRLGEVADYFHEQSELAYADSQRKIPD